MHNTYTYEFKITHFIAEVLHELCFLQNRIKNIRISIDVPDAWRASSIIMHVQHKVSSVIPSAVVAAIVWIVSIAIWITIIVMWIVSVMIWSVVVAVVSIR